MGYPGVLEMWYDFAGTLKELINDFDAIELLNWSKTHGKVDVYIVHPISQPDVVDVIDVQAFHATMKLHASNVKLKTLHITFLPCIGRRLTWLAIDLSPTQPMAKAYGKRPHTSNILPPPSRRAPVRPKGRRKKDVNEKRKDTTTVSRKWMPNKCSVCGKSGHNKSTCPIVPSQPAPSQTQPTTRLQTRLSPKRTQHTNS
ncbi:hypothetical protein KIW84_042250 [Lathyrus oleraceus]|uniref:CCHC-type domain-containing protein n=1 Tax=Pisum sativum TaxID=3888 RepID=A0A9D4XDW0_PEA|nr:hypothetical protein KIW84_042250 [Pisum sativum]